MDVIPIDHLLEKVQHQIHGSRFSAALKTLYVGLHTRKVIKSFGETIPASVMDIIRGKKVFSGFDLIYVSGLYDYLSQKVAVRLTEKLFDMLNRGGRLLIANFLPTIPCRGMMEACGDWWLIYRNEAEMRMLIANLPEEEIYRQELFGEVTRNIIFIEIEKRYKP